MMQRCRGARDDLRAAATTSTNANASAALRFRAVLHLLAFAEDILCGIDAPTCAYVHGARSAEENRLVGAGRRPRTRSLAPAHVVPVCLPCRRTVPTIVSLPTLPACLPFKKIFSARSVAASSRQALLGQLQGEGVIQVQVWLSSSSLAAARRQIGALALAPTSARSSGNSSNITDDCDDGRRRRGHAGSDRLLPRNTEEKWSWPRNNERLELLTGVTCHGPTTEQPIHLHNDKARLQRRVSSNDPGQWTLHLRPSPGRPTHIICVVNGAALGV
jgi:hypothetical protein